MWPDLDLPPINLWNLPDYFGNDNMKKIQIFGYGFVGKSHALALENSNTKVYVYDPYLGMDTLVEDPDAAIICVSTPQDKDGSCDMSNVIDAIRACPNVPILIKSTISVEGWSLINHMFPTKKITFSPEYLRAESAYEDFKNQKVVQIGGGEEVYWKHLLQHSLKVKVEVENPEALILAKYFRNSFLATKVAFFNQVDDLCVEIGIDPYYVCELIAKDERIGKSHTYVTPERGFGGHCFPKDTSAILKTAEYYNSDLSILREAVEYNSRIRKEK